MNESTKIATSSISPVDKMKKLEHALKKCLGAMDMQEKRETGEFMIPPVVALVIWKKAKHLGFDALGITEEEWSKTE